MTEELKRASDEVDDVCREAVGVFHNKASMEAAIDALLVGGFDRREISLLASETTAERKLDLTRRTADELADDPDARRTDYFCPEALGGAEGAVIGGMTYLPAAGAFWIASSVAGTAVAVAATAASGGVGLLVGSALAYWLARRHSAHIRGQLENGGLLVWVRTRTPDLEGAALRILERIGADHAHIHDMGLRSDTARGASR